MRYRPYHHDEISSKYVVWRYPPTSSRRKMVGLRPQEQAWWSFWEEQALP
jgi:hypothetical protein